MKNKTNLLLAAVLISIAFYSCNSKNSQSEIPKKIIVKGSAEIEIVPDEIYMTFTFKEYLNRSRKKVKIEEIKEEFLELCKAAGIPESDISVQSYSGNERWDYWWYQKRKKEPDFMASVSYNIKVNSVEKFDAIVHNLNDEAISNFHINKTSHSKIEEYRKDVKIEALIATKNKAEYLAKSIGEEIGEALLIEEIETGYGYSYGYSNVVSQSSLNFESSDDSPNYQKIKLRYEMKAEFLLK